MALDAGIATVYQILRLCLNEALRVTFFMGRELTTGRGNLLSVFDIEKAK